MSLIRWDPFRELETIQSRLNRLMGETNEPVAFADWTPAVDIQEADTEYVVKADLPEVKKEDVKVNFHNGVLTLEGERNLEKEEKGKTFHKVERAYGRFVRRFAMPNEVDVNKVTAAFKDGVLTVHVPKTVAATPKQVDVKVA